MPHIQVIEGLSLPGSAERENDDALGATSTIAFVLDGVTSVSERPVLPGKSDAAWVAQAARDLLLGHPPNAADDLPALLKHTAQGISERFGREQLRVPEARYDLPWTTISLIGVTAGRLHFANVGDSRALVETADDQVRNFGIKPSRSEFETKLASKMILARQQEAVHDSPTIRETVLADLRRARDTVNTGNGYWLLGIDPKVGDHAKLGMLELAGPATVLLVTDGFYALVEDYKRYGDRELIATAQAIGLQALARELRHIENGDPFGERFPRMKKSDDATALLLRVEP